MRRGQEGLNIVLGSPQVVPTQPRKNRGGVAQAAPPRWPVGGLCSVGLAKPAGDERDGGLDERIVDELGLEDPELADATEEDLSS